VEFEIEIQYFYIGESTPKTHKTNPESFRDFWQYFYFPQLADAQASPNFRK